MSLGWKVLPQIFEKNRDRFARQLLRNLKGKPHNRQQRCNSGQQSHQSRDYTRGRDTVSYLSYAHVYLLGESIPRLRSISAGGPILRFSSSAASARPSALSGSAMRCPKPPGADGARGAEAAPRPIMAASPAVVWAGAGA